MPARNQKKKARKATGHKVAGFGEGRALLREIAPLIHPSVQINLQVLTDATGVLDVESLRRLRRLVHDLIERGTRLAREGKEVPPVGQLARVRKLIDPLLRTAAGAAWKSWNAAARKAVEELLHGALLYGAGRASGELAGYTDPTVGRGATLHPMLAEFKELLSLKLKAHAPALNGALDRAQKDGMGDKVKKALRALFKAAADPESEGLTIDRDFFVQHVPAKWFDSLEPAEQQALYDLGFGAYRHGTELHPYVPPGAREEVAKLDREAGMMTAAGPKGVRGAPPVVALLVSSFQRAAATSGLAEADIRALAGTLQKGLTSRHPKVPEALARLEKLLPVMHPARGQDTLAKAVGDLLRPVMRGQVIDYPTIDNVAEATAREMQAAFEPRARAVAGLGVSVSEVVSGWHNGLLSDREAMQQIAALEGSAGRTAGGYVIGTGVNTGRQGPYGFDGRGPFLPSTSLATLSTGVGVIRGSSIPPANNVSPF